MSNVSSKTKKTKSVPAVVPQATVADAPSPEPSDPTVPNWGPAYAVFIGALSMVGAYLVAGLAAYVLPRIFHMSPSQAETWYNSVSGQFVFLVIAEVTIVGIVLWFLQTRGRSVRSLGFHRRPIWKDLGYVAAAFGVYYIAVAAATGLAKLLLHIDLEAKQELGFDTVISVHDKLLAFVSLVVVPPIAEEFLFRGFLFSGLRTKLPFLWSAVITSALFASLHLAEGSGGVLWVAGIDTFILSLFLCYLREKTNNLWAGIFLHGCKNMIAFGYLYIFVR